MSIIANNFKLNFKVVMVALLLISGLFATTAYGLSKESSAKLNLSMSDNGSNTNIWDGYATVKASVSYVGPSIYGGAGSVSPAVMKSISILPDTAQWIRHWSSPDSFSNTKVSISDRGSYYAHISALGMSTGSMYLKSNDTSW